MAILILALFLLLAVLGCFAGFVWFLAHNDLSPRIAVEKIKNKFRKTLPVQLPSFRDAPYRRLTDQPPRHHPVILNLQTSDGTGQACHPDLTYIPDGLGTGRWRYWMVCTPFPYGNFVHENPEIFASHDGIHWTVPEELKNPIVPTPPGDRSYNSDPDLFFLDEKLWLYYRETRWVSGVWEARIYLTTSPDAAHWTAPVEVLAARGEEALLMSPAVIHERGTFHMWTVERTASGLQIFRRDSSDGVRWDPPAPCALVGLTGRSPWHLDVIREEGRLSALLVSVTAGDWRLHYAYSLDDGNSWNAERILFEPAYEFEEGHLYRATLLKTASKPDKYRVWYSASNRRQMYSIAHLEMMREGSNLVPMLEPAHEELAVAAPR